ncbi:RTA1-domain-containing protein [Lindgomyces ingoldianus]|uniref:RTA1-domain-containing protein n=1 Tax=Lindgomyces ingoldianus TaxID=673940 RepID=A0ACB6R7M3_9PLEO|nr:RTA1-domain-containing protein [Lindgomyces ingoldianus]KAF2474322.1 RTA1-domain-containing protein [Lindgomyces ingoldianus]
MESTLNTILARATLDKNNIDPDNLNLTTTNSTLIGMQRKYCHLGECPMWWATIKYRPTIAGNTIYMILFAILLSVQIFYGIRKKTWTYMSAMIMGCLLEIIGYIGRLMLNNNPFIMNNFLVYLICLTIAPAFFTAGIYLCLSRVITAIGSENSRIKPKMYTYVFVGFDLLSLVLQAIGGALASTAKDSKGSKTGRNVMIAGLVSQVISMALFFIVWADFALRTRRAKLSGALARTEPPLYASLRSTRKFKLFQWSLFIATVLIFVRCIYRVIELQGGFSGHLANDEATFMIFEGPMIILAVTAMTGLHPGRVFDDLWVPAGKGVRSQSGMNKLGSSASTTELTDGSEDWKNNHNTAYQRV